MPSSTPNIWSLYIIRCGDNTLYTGISTDVAKRFSVHTSQGKRSAKYLRGRHPLTLVFQEPIGSKAEASQAEYRVKKLSKKIKEQLIEGELSLRELLERS